MRSMRISFLVLFTWVLMSACSPTIIATAQEKETTKPGTTVDAWRQALPPDAEAQRPAEETPGLVSSLPSNEETEKTLLSLERSWMDSLKAGDADSLSQIISGGFTFVSPRVADVKDRTKYLEYALRDLKLTFYEFDRTRVQLFGRTAIVSGWLKQKVSIGREDWSGTYLITDVWINRDGAWRVVSRHESPLPEQTK